jgi:hypothetical protein
MRHIHGFVFSLTLAACTTASKADDSAGKNDESAPDAGWLVKLDVNGDANCDPERTPEPFALTISAANAKIESFFLHSFRSPNDLLAAPFIVSDDARAFLEQVAADLTVLSDAAQLERYERIALKAFEQAFSPPIPIVARAKFLPSAKLALVLMSADIMVGELLAAQAWLNDVDQTFPDIRAAGESLLVFGTVIRTGGAPSFVIEYDPHDTIITGGAQNEAHDTTLCQLRTGIFDVDAEPMADIAIAKITEVTELPVR